MSHQMLSSQVYIHLLARVHVIRIEYVYNTDWLPCLWQLVMFGYQRALFVEYVEKNNIAMKHMYLQQWDPSFETMPYPPATGLYAIYTATDLVDHINFAMNRVSIWVSTVANNFHDLCKRWRAKPFILCELFWESRGRICHATMIVAQD